MGARNSTSVFDQIMDGWGRKLFDRDGKGNLAVSIPAEFVREADLEPGDDAAIREIDDVDGKGLEIYFK